MLNRGDNYMLLKGTEFIDWNCDHNWCCWEVTFI